MSPGAVRMRSRRASQTGGNLKEVDLRADKESTLPVFNAYDSLRTVEWSALNNLYLAAGKGCSAMVLTMRRPRMVVNFWENLEHEGKVTSVAWDPVTDGRICSSGKDGRLIIWEFRRRNAISRYATTGGPVQVVKLCSLAPDGPLLYSPMMFKFWNS